MKVTAALHDEKANLVDRLEQIHTSAIADDREMNESEQAEFDSITAEISKIDKQIARDEQLKALRKGTPLPEGKGKAGSGVKDTSNKFDSLGDQLLAVMNKQVHHVHDPRLSFVAGGTGMNEQNPADGGFLVQQEFASDLLNNAYETGLLAARVRRRQIGANANGLRMNAVVDTSRATGARYGGIQLYWVDEGGLKTPSKPAFRQIQLDLKKLVGLCYATDELLEDAVALEEIIRDAFRDEFGFVIDDAILRGTGAGQPLGVLNSAAKIAVARTAGGLAIEYADVINMYARLWTRSKSRSTTAWYTSAAGMGLLMQMTLGGTTTVFGSPVFLPPGGLSGRPYATLLGIPVIEIEQAAPVGTEGDIMLLDLQEYLMIDKGRVKSAQSIHVRFIYDETTFRFVYRCNGMPLWNKAQTPAQGTDTVSPFVTLAA